MNKKDWHELGIRILGFYFVMCGLGEMVSAIHYRVTTNADRYCANGANWFLYDLGVWSMPVLYLLGGALAVLYASELSRFFVKDCVATTSSPRIANLSPWIKLISLFFALEQIVPIFRLAGTLGIGWYSREQPAGYAITMRPFEEMAPEIARYIRMELFGHMAMFLLAIFLIARTQLVLGLLTRWDEDRGRTTHDGNGGPVT